MSLYLLLDLLAISIPLLFSFHPRLKFYKKWKFLFPAILITGIPFVLMDIFFTSNGIWKFNPYYLTGVYFFHLPIEEYLFFICVPYACVFTTESLRVLFPSFSSAFILERFLPLSLITVLFFTGVFNFDKWYTVTTFLFTSISLLIAYFYFRKELSHFFLAYLFILIPFFLMNGILTGSFIDMEVVWYDNRENLGIRLFTIPLEDIFYGLSLILWNVLLTSVLTKFKKLR